LFFLDRIYRIVMDLFFACGVARSGPSAIDRWRMEDRFAKKRDDRAENRWRMEDRFAKKRDDRTENRWRMEDRFAKKRDDRR